MTTQKGPFMVAFSALARLVLISSLLISVLLFSGPVTQAGPTAQDGSGFEIIHLPSDAINAPVAIDRAESGSSKMEFALEQVATVARASQATALATAEAEQLRVMGERVQVLITTTAARADAAAEAVARAGGEVTGRANGETWLQAWAPVSGLEEIAADASIDYVSRPSELVTMATTEGSAIINAPAWHAAGKMGAGVRVAIIDGGFQGYASLLGGDLPASVTVKNFVDGETDSQVNGTTVHGTACAEIVRDIAPSASLFLAKVGTNVDLEEAVNWAKAQNVNIITTSLGWYNLTPGDGTGFFANLVQSAKNAGILWTTAAGNDRQAHWGGAFSDGDGDNYHQFSGTQEVNFFGPGDGNAYNIPAGYPIRVYLRWDDWTAKNQDYDLYVVKWNGSTWAAVASSLNRQTGGVGQTPTEYVGILSSGSTAPYGFVIQRYSSNRNVNLEVFAPKVARLDKIVTARSLANLADAPDAMTVAALDVTSPYPQESYSSEGPVNGAGGTANGGATKPDISGFANVSTSSYPDPSAKFNGTSSATPHVAGAAALVKAAFPAYTPAQIQSFLEGRAIDMGAAGKDTVYGWGHLHLGAPPSVNPPGNRKVYLPLALRGITPVAPSWTTILSDGFEGAFPGPWQLWNSGGYNWGKRSCRAFAGSNSAWAIGGNEQSCYATYPNNIASWMYFGPFSLSDATAADVKFKLWNNTESGADQFCILASVDDDDYFGRCGTGNTFGWIDQGLDLANVYTLGDLRGRPQVWIAFILDTDSSVVYSDGTHVDDVVIRKCATASCAGPAAGQSIGGLESTAAHMKRPK